jgi:hypothetical protein
MIKSIRFLACLCAFVCLTRTVLGWGAEGHMVVAQLAYNHLDAAVKAKCDALIAVNLGSFTSNGTSNFVTSASWADDFKTQLGSAIWHYIDLPFSLDGTTTNGFPPASFDVLQDPTQPLANQATALRYLIHFVGDIEQPLHCSTAISAAHTGGDGGGNSFNITGTWNNLHSLWDAGGGFVGSSITRPFTATSYAIITSTVASVEAAYPYPVTTIGPIPNPMDWAQEGWGLAQTVAYVGITNGTTPTASYLSTAQATSKQRMAIGGQRLAKLLTNIYVTNAPPLISAVVINGNFGLTWGTVTGRIYRVQWKQQPTDPAWTDLTDITVSNTSVTFTDPVLRPQRFYRIIVVN